MIIQPPVQIPQRPVFEHHYHKGSPLNHNNINKQQDHNAGNRERYNHPPLKVSPESHKFKTMNLHNTSREILSDTYGDVTLLDVTLMMRTASTNSNKSSNSINKEKIKQNLTHKNKEQYVIPPEKIKDIYTMLKSSNKNGKRGSSWSSPRWDSD